MRAIQLNFYGDHNIGIFGRASEKLCILGSSVSDKECKKIEATLGVRVLKATVSHTDLVGMFCCMNSYGAIVPSIAREEEIERMRSAGLNIQVLKAKFTALGNLILCNDKGAVVGKPLERYKEEIGTYLGVDATCTSVAGMSTVGSCGIATNKGCILHRDAKEDEIKEIEKILDVEVGIGTANFGSPFVGSCAIANSLAVAVGQSTTGPEINRIMEALKLF